MRDNADLVAVAIAFLGWIVWLGWIAWLGNQSREAEYLDLLRRCESVQWRQGSEVGRECPICFGDKEHLDGCELAEALEGND